MKLVDNIVNWGTAFNPPYRFIVGKTVLWDASQDIVVHVVDDPVFAYAIYSQLKEEDKKYIYSWYLKDSFNRDALEFCKKMTDSVSLDLLEEVKFS